MKKLKNLNRKDKAYLITKNIDINDIKKEKQTKLNDEKT